MKEIRLTNSDKVALVDDMDYDLVAARNWNLHVVNGRESARSSDSEHIKMNKLIFPAPEGLETNHINHNALDNRRSNMEHCTHQENCRRRRKRSGCVKVVRGTRWRALLWGKHLGYFATEAEAWAAVDMEMAGQETLEVA